MPTPNAITATQFQDLTQVAIRDLGEPNWTDLYSQLQRYTVLPQITKKDRVVIESGYGIQFNAMVNTGQASQAQNISPTGVSGDNINVSDTQIQAQVDWRGTGAAYALFAPVVAMARTPRRIVDYAKTQRDKCLIDAADIFETNWWGPPVNVSDSLTPWGVNTWVVKNGTEGFTGTAPSGYTVLANINPTTYPSWCNYAGPYSSASPDDLWLKVARSCRFTDFQAPVAYPSPNTGNHYQFFTNNAVLQACEQGLEARNDNLGDDLAPKQNQVTLHRETVQWVPKLEPDSTNPFYGLNFGWIKTYILAGWWAHETMVPQVAGQHLASAYFIDWIYNFVFKNRRTSFVWSNGTTYPN